MTLYRFGCLGENKMKTMIEFFSGSKVLSNLFKENGYEVFTVDFNEKLNPDLNINILDFEIKMLPEEFREPTVIWASPPCTTFSVASISHYWINRKPRRWQTYIGLAITKKTFELIQELNPKYWFIENPVGMLRKQHFIEKYNSRTVTYCQYGENYRKPTDIWTNANHWVSKKMCMPGNTCHEEARRTNSLIGGVKGIVTGVMKDKGLQALKSNYDRSKLPILLCQEIVDVCEDRQKIKQMILE